MKPITSIEEANLLYRQFLARSYDVIFQTTTQAAFPDWRGRTALILAYQATIIEMADAIKLLLDENKHRAAFILLRSALEAFIDLKCTMEVQGYPDRRELDFIADRLRVLNEANTGENFALAGVKASGTVNDEIAGFEDRARVLKERGATPTRSIKTRFELAGELDMYGSVYNRLCAASHNDPGEIAWRHFHWDEKGTPWLVLFQAGNSTELLLLLDNLCGILVQSALIVQSIADIQSDRESIDRISVDLIEIRKAVESFIQPKRSDDADDPTEDLEAG